MRKKQPKGLYLLFFTELWERFGFRTQQALLVLFMSQSLHYPDKKAYLVYGAFSAMLYMTPPIGGYLADRFLGFQRAVLLGGALFIIGYLLTAVPSIPIFFLGLSFVIVANGFFKPNVSCLLGDLYHDVQDPRRDGGFTLFYMGINIGALIPPLFIGYFVKVYGWHLGFLFSALGMFIGMLTFLVGRKVLGAAGAVPKGSLLLLKSWKRTFFYVLLTLGILLSLFLFYFVFGYPEQANILLIAISAAVILLVLYRLTKEDLLHRNRLLASLILIVISIVFWAIYNQTFTSLILFAKRNMEQSLFGIPINAEFMQFFNPFFIVVLSPFLSVFWSRQKNPKTPLKFSWACAFMAAGFFVLFLGGKFFGMDGETSPWWLIFSYFLQTIGELLLSPIGLSMITRLSPKHLVGLMMGVWFLTQTASYSIGSELSLIADVPKNLSGTLSLPIYTHAFLIYGFIALGITVVSFSLIPYLNRLIEEK